MEQTPTRREFMGLLAGATAATAMTSHASAQVDNGEWPMASYDPANTGSNPDATGPQDDVGALWEFESESAFGTGPVTADGLVYAGGINGDVVAVDAESGEREWTVGLGAELRATPTVADGVVYVPAGDGVLYAFDATDGSDVWQFETGGELTGPAAVRRDEDGEVDLVFVGSWDTNVYAVEAETGDEHWVFEAFENGIEAGVAYAALDDGTEVVYAASDEGARLVAIDATAGEELWVFTGDEFSTAPVVADELVYVCGRRTHQLFTLDAATGEERWSFQTGSVSVAAPAVADDVVYLPSRDQRVYAIESDVGARWEVDMGTMVNESPAVDSDTVYASSAGTLRALDSDTGDERWAFDLSSLSAPAVVEDRVYVTSGERLLALGEGGEDPTVDGLDGDHPADGDDDDEGALPSVRFLLWPLSALAMLGTVVGILYAAKRTGMLDRIEEAADRHAPDEETVAATAPSDPAEEAASSLGPGTPSPVWALVQKDVIARADETVRTATNDLIVTKYVDSETLESPLVAYEIESLRDEPATVEIREPLARESLSGEDRPIGDTWSIDGGSVSFEGTVEPGETIRTVVGRRDYADELPEALLDRPEITVDAIPSS